MSEPIKRQDILQSIATEIRHRVPPPERDAAEAFAKAYYANVSLGDLAEMSLDSLIASVYSMWIFGHKRTPGHAKIRVYTEERRTKNHTIFQTIVETINDNMPFLVDSIIGSINSLGHSINLVIHPVMHVERNNNHKLTKIEEHLPDQKSTSYESFIHCEILGILPPEKIEALQQEIARALNDVRDAVNDWDTMRARLQTASSNLKQNAPDISKEEMDETLSFLEWIEDGHFTFLGFCEYSLIPEQTTIKHTLVPQEGLGILNSASKQTISHIFGGIELTPTNRRYIMESEPLIITKASQISLVHRRDPMDSITIKKFDKKGNIIGFYQFIGLFTSAAYNQSARKIPLLRRKIARILTRSCFSEQWHDGKTLIHILESFPRDELFQATEDWLFKTSMAILQLQNRQRLTLFIRPDKFERFISCIVYIPRERYDSDLRRKIEKILERSFHGKSTNWQTQLGELAFARIHYIITRVDKGPLSYDPSAIENEIIREALSWRDHLLQALLDHLGEEKGRHLFEHYGQGFTKGYQERVSAESAVTDIIEIEHAFSKNRLRSNIHWEGAKEENILTFKLYSIEGPVSLSDVLPVLENMDLRVLSEIPFIVSLSDGQRVWIHDFEVQSRAQDPVNLEAVRDHFLKGFSHVWREESENDGFNRLIMRANLDWRECQLIRAYAKYIRQLQVAFSLPYMEETLANYPSLCRLMIELFSGLFSPDYREDRNKARQEILYNIKSSLKNVNRLEEEIILNSFVNAINCTLRTNYYQLHKGKPKTYLSFKIDCKKINDMPLPRPTYEVFVYSTQVEALHLRGGKVARGGIRWSERREDFRTEVLGLMKAQMVKNAVIIPVGSKGGFIVKRLLSEKRMKHEIIDCYKIFIRGLLDITDNVKESQIIPPANVVRHDGDDPYLVVAADKGTSSFSDYANDISAEYDFWLGDAFASGGSTGYDHKKMGITARGAWESVKRHFREMDKDAPTDAFTVVGIGDMSGDVFGNGMLMSRHLSLVGAFNHSHIFIDPSPSPEKSYDERKRLFNLPQSTWGNYTTSLISKGGGVFDRQAKSIPITPEMKFLFDIQEDELTPAELIRYLLRSSVDLLWFGGIGSYIKARNESNNDVGDRANDNVRINGESVRALVIAEGANLGLTQLGRIEYAKNGGRLNTDAIDNSAGVDCSDHEVNLKILLNRIVAKGDLSLKNRNALLETMTDNVALLVLEDNIWQNQAISLAQSQGVHLFEEQVYLLRELEKEGILNRALENLPDEVEVGNRIANKTALTRPELAVLLAYSKISLNHQLIKSSLPDLTVLNERLLSYFPKVLQKPYEEEITTHPLKREIISTLLTNNIINKMGITFVQEMKRQTNTSDADVAKAYLVVEELLNLGPLWQELEALKEVATDLQTALMLRTREKVIRFTDWFLRFGEMDNSLEKILHNFKPGFDVLYKKYPDLFSPAQRQTYEEKCSTYEKIGLPSSLTKALLSLGPLISAPDIIILSKEAGINIETVARVYFAICQQLQLEWLRTTALGLSGETHWQQEAIALFIDDLYKNQALITKKVIKTANSEHKIFNKNGMIQPEILKTTYLDPLLVDIMGSPLPDFSMLMVINHQLHLLAETPFP